MATKVYGHSDDVIEFEGDLYGEVGSYEARGLGALLAFSDGTILLACYGKSTGAIWAFSVLHKGDLFDRIETCDDEDADPYSDVVYFKDGKLKAWHGREAERVG